MENEFFGEKGYEVLSDSRNSHALKVTTWKEFNEMHPSTLLIPSTLSDVQEIVRQANRTKTKIKCIGAGHSFTPVALVDDGGILVSLEKMADVLQVSDDFIKVQAGCTLAKMIAVLKTHGRQLPACPEYGPFFAGAFSGTQLHESAGNLGRIPTLSAYAVSYTVVKPDGSVEKVEEDLEYWRNHQGLGGIVIDVTFKTIPLDKVLVEYDVIPRQVYWPKRHEAPDGYDEFFTIYIPQMDSFFIEKRRYVDAFPEASFMNLRQKWGTFLRKSLMIKCMPWFYSSLKHIPMREWVLRFGINVVFRVLFTNQTFYSLGADRGVVFQKRPFEIYNDYMYDEDTYPQAFSEIVERVHRNPLLVSSTLIASYRVPQDQTCIMSRTYHRQGFSIDPILYRPLGSNEQKELDAVVKEVASKYRARPHFNKVITLGPKQIQDGYDQDNIVKFLEWCDKVDPEGIFQGTYYRMLKDAVLEKVEV